MDAVCLILSMHPSLEQARSTATMLVTEHLAACCNLLPGAESIYQWEGQLTTTAEIAMISKTVPAQAAEAMARIRALHPYALPEILQLPVHGGLEGFMAWIQQQSRPA